MEEVVPAVDEQSSHKQGLQLRDFAYLRFVFYLALPVPVAGAVFGWLGICDEWLSSVLFVAAIMMPAALAVCIGFFSFLAWFTTDDPLGHFRVMLFCASFVAVSRIGLFVFHGIAEWQGWSVAFVNTH